MEGTENSFGDERARILRMVEQGDISAADAIALLDRLAGRGGGAYTAAAGAPEMAGAAYGEGAPEIEDAPEAEFAQSGLPHAAPQVKTNGGPTWLRVRVTDLNTGRNKASVSIPFKLASWGLRLGARFEPKVEGIDLAELSHMLNQGGAQGMLVDVVDEEDGEHVQIYLE